MGNELSSQTETDWRTLGNRDDAVLDSHPSQRIYVGRRRTFLGVTRVDSWQEHTGTFDEVVKKIQAKALEGKASSEGFEVVEMSIARSVIVKPVITATEVTEVIQEATA